MTLKISERWRESEQRTIQAEADRANAELSLLKAQVNPHFLFNTLNNIYSLAVTNNKNKAINFDLNTSKNQLQAIGKNCYIGKYTGREEGVLTVNGTKGIFGFVIEGAFEFQNRLLETRDNIALWNEDNEALQIEFEALSNDAIILIVEVIIKDGSSF